MTYEELVDRIAEANGGRWSDEAVGIADALMPTLAEVWAESHEHCSSIGCPNPYGGGA